MARRKRGPGVVRLGVSLEPDLLAVLDGWVRRRNSPSRSEAIRALIRQQLTSEELAPAGAPAVACVMLLYRHDAPNVLERLTAAEHRWGDHIRFSGHVHLEGDACMEVIAVSGTRREVEQIAEDLRGVKRILFGAYTIGSAEVAGPADDSTPHEHRVPPRPVRSRPTGGR